MRRTIGQIRAALSAVSSPALHALSPRARAGFYVARLSVRILKEWARDRCPQQAAALAFQTTLSLVPILAIAFTALRGAGLLDAQSQLLTYLATHILPDLPDVAEHLRLFSDNISVGAAGAGGLAFTFLTCWALFSTVGKIFNDIWRVKMRRSFLYRVLVFYALVTLLPILAGVYLYWSGRLISSESFAAKVFGPLVIQFAALYVTNKLLPNTFVRWQAALAGTLVSGILLEALKWGFVTFARRILLDKYAGAYGTVGLVPVVLLWIYASWLIVLLGVEITHSIQNLRRLEVAERRLRQDEPPNGALAAQLLAAVAADFQRGGQGVNRDALAQDFSLPPETIERIIDRLKAGGLIAEVQGDKQGLIPSRPPGAISLTEIFAAFRSRDLETAAGPLSPTLAALVRELDEGRRGRLANLTLVDILPRDVLPLRDADSAVGLKG